MNKYWQRFSEWFDARNERERILIIIVSVVAIISFWLGIVSDPQQLRRKQLESQEVNVGKQAEAVQIQINAIMERSQKDPNKSNELKISQLQKNIEVLNSNLRNKMRGFVEPGRMPALLEDVLKQKRNMELVRLVSLPAEYLVADTKPKDSKGGKAGLYRHGFKLELHGSYLHTLDYLQALEELPWDFYWDAIDIDIVKYPQAKIVLQLHTISLKESWIGV